MHYRQDPRNTGLSTLVLDKLIEVTLSDRHTLKALRRGVVLKMNMLGGVWRKCNLNEVLYVLGLSYNLVSAAKATEHGIKPQIYSMCCIVTSGWMLVSKGTRVGSLYTTSTSTGLSCQCCMRRERGLVVPTFQTSQCAKLCKSFPDTIL